MIVIASDLATLAPQDDELSLRLLWPAVWYYTLYVFLSYYSRQDSTRQQRRKRNKIQRNARNIQMKKIKGASSPYFFLFLACFYDQPLNSFLIISFFSFVFSVPFAFVLG